MSEHAGYDAYEGCWEARAQLAWDTIAMRSVTGIPTWGFQTMQWSQLEELSGNPPGSYPRDPVRVYREFMRQSGVCFIDQWIPDNPLTMRDAGYEDSSPRGATTGARQIVRDGIAIDSPEAVAAHLERVLIPSWEQWGRDLRKDPDAHVRRLIAGEIQIQDSFGMDLLKGPYGGFFAFPGFLYGLYGYANYFMAYALFPDIIERGFRAHADAAEIHNRLAARAIVEGGLPRLVRLDHDMADSRGVLVDVRSLDRIWFPHFARAVRPFLDAGIRLIWHCDGNLSAMVPRLIEAGIAGFQGFQYEDGMDYEGICRMRDRDGNPLFIIAGVSVTRTLPFGSPADVRDELARLVDRGPKTGLMLGCSSSITPGVPMANLRALIDGLAFYRRGGARART